MHSLANILGFSKHTYTPCCKGKTLECPSDPNLSSFFLSYHYFIISNNHPTFLRTHDVANSFPSCIIEVHLKISLLMNNYYMKHMCYSKHMCYALG
jgi:hypothetical protein